MLPWRRRTHPIFLLSLALSTTGCSAARDDTIDRIFDPCAPLVLVPADDASAPERTSVAEAVAAWNAVLPTGLTLDDAPAAARLPVRFREAASIFYGEYLDEDGAVVINRRLTDARARAVTIAHELGHAFGLRHVPRDERSSVMNPGNLETAPTADDAEALAARWGRCGP